jgi:hypothetical protein
VFLGTKFWICALNYDMCRPEFDYVAEALTTLQERQGKRFIDAINWTDRDKSHIRLANGKIEVVTKSLRDYLKVAMEAPDGIIICEADQVPWPTVERLLMRTTQTMGWVYLSGTYESSLGWQAQKWKEWQGPNNLGAKSFSLPTWTNIACFPDGRTDPKIKQWEDELPYDVFMERFGGIPCPPSGLVIPEFAVDVHVRDLKVDSSLPVYVWVDPGYGGGKTGGVYAVEFVQIVNDRIQIVDEIYERGLVTTDILKLVMFKPYMAQIKSGVVDVAATQHHAMPAVSEIWAKQDAVEGWPGLYLESSKVDVDASVDRLRTYFKYDPLQKEPRILIDYHCEGLISELGGCKPRFEFAGPWQYKKAKDGTVIGYEDKNDHAISTLRYGIVNNFGYTRDKIRSKAIEPVSWY